jgi:selenocysteine lyase/cysteine desulfurase
VAGGRRCAISTEAYEGARRAVAEFVRCPAGGSTIFVRNTTEAANLLAAALLRGSRILCTPFANLLPWRIHRVSHVPFTSSADELLGQVEPALAGARAAGEPFDLLAVSGASNVTGEVTPLPELASTAHSYRAKIFVDAAQLAPHRPIHMERSDVDFLAFSGHKLSMRRSGQARC